MVSINSFIVLVSLKLIVCHSHAIPVDSELYFDSEFDSGNALNFNESIDFEISKRSIEEEDGISYFKVSVLMASRLGKY